jgi:predicted dehydrogenase
VTRPITIAVVGTGSAADGVTKAFAQLRAVRVWGAPSGRFLPSWYDDVLADEDVDAVAIATRPSGDDLVRRALTAGKHVLAAGPLSRDAAEARALLDLAEQGGRCLLVAHEPVFHAGIRKLRELVELHRLGDVYYVCSLDEVSPGSREDDIVWSTGADQVAGLLYLLDDVPREVRAWGAGYGNRGATQVVTCVLGFAGGVTAHLHLSSLCPARRRRLSIVGGERTAVFDNANPARPVTIFEPVGPRSSCTMVAPQLPAEAPLESTCETFVTAIATGLPLAGESRTAADVVDVLEALQRSLDRRGAVETFARDAADDQLRVVALPRR